MPSSLTHQVFGNIISKNLPINIDKNYFNWGLQGPDFLFFHNFGIKNKINAIGYKIHSENIAETFNLLFDYVKQNAENEIILSYCVGFLCHYVLDKICHAYIYHLSDIIAENEKVKKYIAHRRIESRLDCYIQNNSKNILITDKNIISNIWIISKNIFNKNLKQKHIKNSLKNMLRTLKFLEDKNGNKYKKIYSAEKILHIPHFISSLIIPQKIETILFKKQHKFNKIINKNIKITTDFDEIWSVSIAETHEYIQYLIEYIHKDIKFNKNLFEVNFKSEFIY